jgi:hypothetical protein
MYCKCDCGEKLSEKSIENGSKFIQGHSLRGKNHWGWNGGKSKTYLGHIQIRQPNHPFATKRGYVREHRLIMEKHLGRYLKKCEEVHHINGIVNDNRLENLVILTKREHTSLHHKGLRKPNSEKNLPKMTTELAKKGWETRRKNMSKTST